MKRAVIGSLVILGLSGFGAKAEAGQDQRFTVFGEQLQRATRECQSTLPGNAWLVDLVACEAPKFRRAWVGLGFRDVELWELFIEFRRGVAARLDIGDLPKEEATPLIQRTWKVFSEAFIQRNTSADEALNERLRALGLFFYGLGVYRQSP